MKIGIKTITTVIVVLLVVGVVIYGIYSGRDISIETPFATVSTSESKKSKSTKDSVDVKIDKTKLHNTVWERRCIRCPETYKKRNWVKFRRGGALDTALGESLEKLNWRISDSNTSWYIKDHALTLDFGPGDDNEIYINTFSLNNGIEDELAGESNRHYGKIILYKIEPGYLAAQTADSTGIREATKTIVKPKPVVSAKPVYENRTSEQLCHYNQGRSEHHTTKDLAVKATADWEIVTDSIVIKITKHAATGRSPFGRCWVDSASKHRFYLKCNPTPETRHDGVTICAVAEYKETKG